MGVFPDFEMMMVDDEMVYCEMVSDKMMVDGV